MSEYERSPGEIEREIEATRERMSRDIGELGDRLSPESLKRQAKEAISAGARRTGFRMMDFIQENPSLVAAMGLGAVWLVQQRNRSEISGDRMSRFAYTGPERRGSGLKRRLADRVSEVRDTVGSAAGEVAGRAGELGSEARERARELGHRAQEQTRRARTRLERMMEENPLAVAAGVAVLGLAAGLLVPETERERRVMGPVRDDLAERAQHTAERVKDAALEAGQEVRDTVKEEISSRAPELTSTLKDAAQAVTQQVKESAGRVKEEAKQAARESSTGREPPA